MVHDLEDLVPASRCQVNDIYPQHFNTLIHSGYFTSWSRPYNHSRITILWSICRKVQNNPTGQRLELQGLALLLLVTTQLKVLTSLQSQLGLGLADNTLQSQDNLLGGLSLLVEDWLGLTTVTALLTVVSSLTLGKQGSLTSLVLGDLVLGVLLAVLALAVGSSGFWDVN